MISFDRITLIVEPPDPAPVGLYQPPREAFHLDEFAAQVAKHACVPWAVFDGPIANAPVHGYLLAYGGSVVDALSERPDGREVLSRTVLIDVHRSIVLKDLESFGLAAAIETHRFFDWHANRANESGRHLYGLREVARRMGGECQELDGVWSSTHYCLFDDTRRVDLPDLLAAYLRTHAATV